MKINKNHLSIFIIGMAFVLMLTGCGRIFRLSSRIETDRQKIAMVFKDIALTINNYDNNAFFELFDEDLRSTEMYDQISRFNSTHSDITEAYVNVGGYSGERFKDSPYTGYRLVHGTLVTNDNIYSLLLDFKLSKKDFKITRLWIVSAKTEAKEHENWQERYHFPDDAVFEYADYYDSEYQGEYKLIWGDVLSWDPTASIVDLTDLKDEEWEEKPVNDFLKEYGPPGAEYSTIRGGYHILYYGAGDGTYTQIFLHDDDTIRKIQNTDKIGYGITGIKEIQLE